MNQCIFQSLDGLRSAYKMNFNKYLMISVVLLVQTSFTSVAQSNIGVKFFGLSIHPKGEQDNAFLMPRKLDENGYLVMNLGGMLTYEKFIWKDHLSVKVVSAVYADCADRLGGFGHIGLRGKIFKWKKHSIYGGIGPTVVLRRSWKELQGYVDLYRFRDGPVAHWQYLFLWYGGEFEYKCSFTENWDFAATFVPGYPDLMSLSFGVHYKMSPNKVNRSLRNFDPNKFSH